MASTDKTRLAELRSLRKAWLDRKAKLAQSPKQARAVTTDDLVKALGLLRHHGIKPIVNSDYGLSAVQIRVSPKMAMGMARAYIENHLAEQFGNSVKFEVEAGSSEIYIDLPGR